jgi:hypothetical protein
MSNVPPVTFQRCTCEINVSHTKHTLRRVGGEVGWVAAYAHSSGADIQVAGRCVCGG